MVVEGLIVIATMKAVDVNAEAVRLGPHRADALVAVAVERARAVGHVRCSPQVPAREVRGEAVPIGDDAWERERRGDALDDGTEQAAQGSANHDVPSSMLTGEKSSHEASLLVV